MRSHDKSILSVFTFPEPWLSLNKGWGAPPTISCLDYCRRLW